MSLHGYTRRRRRQNMRRYAKTLFVLGLLAASHYLAFATGQQHVERHDAELQRRIDELEQQAQTQDTTTRQADANAHMLENQLKDLQARYAQDVPAGDLARLSGLVAGRLKDGVDPERLAFVIGATQNPRDCKPTESKRFILPTGLGHQPGNAAVAFANGTITVSGTGIAHHDAAGNPSGWFDPDQPVTIKFVVMGGGETVAQGQLPLHQSLVIGNTEHRFTITAGSHSLVEVTADSCSFP